jgi:hypothetical protein
LGRGARERACPVLRGPRCSNAPGLPGSDRQPETPFLDFADRVRPPQSAFNPWLDIIVPASNAAPLIDSITGLLQQASRDTGTAMPLVVLAVLTSATLRQPLLRAPAEGDLFIIDVQQSTDSAGTAASMVARNRQFTEQARSIGGTFYPYSAVEASPSDWRRHFGSGWRGWLPPSGSTTQTES